MLLNPVSDNIKPSGLSLTYLSSTLLVAHGDLLANTAVESICVLVDLIACIGCQFEEVGVAMIVTLSFWVRSTGEQSLLSKAMFRR